MNSCLIRKSDFYIPVDWNNRKPLLLDQLLYLPEFFQDFDHYPFPWKEGICKEDKPISMEYCSGNGQWILEQAKNYPERYWIAVEKRFDRARKIWVKMKNQKLNNLFIVFGEGMIFSEHYIPSQSIQEVFINFPDPWPKKKHAKNRLLQESFVHQLARIVTKSGKLTLVTDDVDYRDQMLREFSNWKSLFPKPYYATDLKDFGDSYFDSLWRKKGRTIHYLCYLNEPS